MEIVGAFTPAPPVPLPSYAGDPARADNVPETPQHLLRGCRPMKPLPRPRAPTTAHDRQLSGWSLGTNLGSSLLVTATPREFFLAVAAEGPCIIARSLSTVATFRILGPGKLVLRLVRRRSIRQRDVAT